MDRLFASLRHSDILPSMANKFYAHGEERPTKIHDLFARIAPRYDLINDLQSFGLHRLWKRQLLQQAKLKSGDRLLDLCCGTGDIVLAAASAGACAVGLDFSAEMLAVAQQRTRRFATSRPSRRSVVSLLFLRGDALRIPFDPEQFDVVTISYGLRNLASFDGALREMWRVLKPGGRLLVLDFGKPDNPFWRSCYFGYLRCCVPLFGRIFYRDSETYGYIHESLSHYPAQNGVAALLGEIGCDQVSITNLLGGIMSINSAVKCGCGPQK